MTNVIHILQYTTAAGFVLLAAITIRDWLQFRVANRAYLAAAIGLLAYTSVVSQFSGFLHPPVSLVVSELVLVAFMASGYALLLFRDTMIPLSARAKSGAGILSVISAAGIGVMILVPHVPESLLFAAAILLIAVWMGLVGEPVIRLWRVSRDRPAVQRARLRALSAGYGSIVVILFVAIAAAPLAKNQWYQLGIQLLSIAVIPILYVAFAPPGWLRRVWRTGEEEAFSGAIRDLLLFSPDRQLLAERSLDWAIRLVGADSGLIVDAGAELLATEGLDEATRALLTAELLRGTSGIIQLDGSGGRIAIAAPLQTEIGTGGLAVVSGPFTPVFGSDEVVSLQQYSASFLAALDRVRLVESLRASERSVRRLNRDLESSVTERTSQLEASNKELEAFSYTISHDLRAPLRAIDGFSRILLEEHRERLDEDGRRYLDLVSSSAVDMGRLIDALLTFSRLSRQEMTTELLQPADVAAQAVDRMRADLDGRSVQFDIKDLPPARSDAVLLGQVYANLIGNAVKFSRDRDPARVEVGFTKDARGAVTYYVRDNGVGFDMRYADKLFGVFQRLHGGEEFAGAGAGLAIVQRIVRRHGGETWAESEPGKGATFYFTLGGRRDDLN